MELYNIQRSFDQWWSPSLGRDMELLMYGEAGTPILAFPGNEGNYYDWEQHGLVEALQHQLENGYNQLFCVDSLDDEALLNRQMDGSVRIIRHRQYESYVIDEIIPYILNKSARNFLIITGMNMGALHAFNMAIKYPHYIGKLVAMSGVYDIKPYVADHYDHDVYICNPMDYLPNMDDPDQLNQIRNTDIRMLVSAYDPEFADNRHICDILNQKSIDHMFEVWRDSEIQEWDVWAEMLKTHIP